MVNSPLIRPYLLGGGSFGGGTLDSHESMIKCFFFFFWGGVYVICKVHVKNMFFFGTVGRLEEN